MPKDYKSISFGDPTFEIKAGYIYRDGEVYKRLKNGDEGRLMKKYTGTHGRGFYWTLCGMRQYEDWAKKYLTHINPSSSGISTTSL